MTDKTEWRAVPLEPTDAMRHAGHEAWMAATQDALSANPGREKDGPRSNIAAAYRAMVASAPAAGASQPIDMSPEFTDTARAALLWVLWHHQGGSSPVGQPLRFALGMGTHEPLQPHHVAEAKRWATLTGSKTAEFHDRAHAQAAAATATRPLVLMGIGKINGDGWKDTTRIGEVIYAWNRPMPEPYAAGQFPRVGVPIWSASTAQYDFRPVSDDEAIAVIDRTIEELRMEVARLRDRLADIGSSAMQPGDAA